MDDSSRGIATAALTLHSNLLQTLVRKAVPTPTEALEVVDRSLIAVWGTQDEPAAQAVAQAGQGSRLQGKHLLPRRHLHDGCTQLQSLFIENLDFNCDYPPRFSENSKTEHHCIEPRMRLRALSHGE